MFISYAQESPEHIRWVLQLALDLHRKGVYVLIDQWDLRYGHDLPHYMEDSIRKADRVLLICTPAFKRKADERKGGVGYEGMVVTGELAKDIATTKFIPVLRDGTKETSVPTFMGTKLYASFVDNTEYEVEVEKLLRELLQAPTIERPPLGPNPFLSGKAGSEPASLRVSSPSVNPVFGAEDAYAKAEQILRQRDLLGWNRLVRATVGQVWPRLSAWRKEFEAANVQNASRWAAGLVETIGITGPAMVLALSAVESEIVEIRRQRALLDEFLSTEAWGRSGHSHIIALPTALAYAYHHILGAFLVRRGDARAAIDLLTTVIRYPDTPSTMPLWQVDPLMGWSKALGNGTCTVAWKWLIELYDSQTWLSHFFPTKQAYESAIEDYGFLASLIELASMLKRGEDLSKVNQTQVPPLFLPMYAQDLAAMVVRVVPDRQVVEAIARAGGATADALAKAWPQWALALSRTVSRFGNPMRGLMVRAVEDVPRLP